MNVSKEAKPATQTANQKLRHPRTFQSITVVKMAAVAEMRPEKALNTSQMKTVLSRVAACATATFSALRF
jgi:hypothetical protein